MPAHTWSLEDIALERPLAHNERWHKTEGWKEEDLPPGYRPLLISENFKTGDQFKYGRNGGWHTEMGHNMDRPCVKIDAVYWLRTNRPMPEINLPDPPTL